MEWTDDTIIRLRTLWDEGLSTAEIGRRLSVSKNSVVGKAHRLELPARPSPIRRDGAVATLSRESAPRRVSGPTLPSMATASVALPKIVARSLTPVSTPTRPSLVAAMAAPAHPTPRVPSCCWPIGEPGTPSFRFCSDEALPNKPYCAAHAEIAYVRVRDRREGGA
ncbi:GcrA family cell cycle regulator [Acidiphilium sp.]|uniref:GcrA family cell cycle regulator n=1 Tax=Acidiphilium sp. TaxID=527 RepID=UPI003CFC0DDE